MKAEPGITHMALIGHLGTPQLACLRSWRRHGVPCLFLHTDAAPLPRLVQWLLGVPCVHLGPLQLDDAAYVQRLASALTLSGSTALTCVSEPTSVALWALAAALPRGLKIAAVTPGQAAQLASKVWQDEAARQAGLSTLPSWHLMPDADAALVPAHAYPLVLRPDIVRTVQPPFKVAVVEGLDALRAFLRQLAPSSGGVIAQPLVRGPNLLVHGYRSAQGHWGGHVGFRAAVKHGGFTVTLKPCALPQALREACARLEARLGLTGVFHYDFVEDAATGQAWFLDLNPRLGGSTGKVLAAGYDEPLALVGTLQPGRISHGRVVARPLRATGGKHQALGALLSALRGRSTAADYPYPDRRRLFTALAAYLLAGRDEIVRGDALRSALAFALYHALRLRRAALR